MDSATRKTSKLGSILESFPEGRSPRPLQVEALLKIESAWNDSDVIVVDLPVACHHPSQQVLMFDGTTKPMAKVKPGDVLMGPDSGPRQVFQVHSGAAPLFMVTPKRGNSYLVTAEHQWPLRVYKRPMTGGERVGEFVTEIKSTKELLVSSKDYLNNAWLYKTAISFTPKELPIDPYAFGLWLGDGHSVSPSLTVMDKELAEYWVELATKWNLFIRVSNNGSKASSYHITGKRIKENTLLKALQGLGVINNKHIPLAYKTGSLNQRCQLLAGIMDTDGSCDQAKSSFEITSKFEQLADDILFVIRSIGWSAEKAVRTIKGKPYWRITGSRPPGAPALPVLLKRKELPEAKSDQRNRKFEISPAGYGPYVGVTVDQDNLYVLDDFTVTHNSGKSLIAQTIARWALKQKVKSRVLTPTNILVEQYLRDFPYLHTLPAASKFTCTNSIVRDEDGQIIDSHSCAKEKTLGEKVYCSGCPYLLRKKQGYAKPYGVYNLYTYLANQYHRPLLIIDEAHNLLPMLRDINAKKFWRGEYNYPASTRTYGQIHSWLVSALRTATSPRKEKLEFFLKEITSKKTRFIVDRGMELLRGVPEDCIKLLPVDVRDGGGLLWPSKKVNKLVLMSATINRKDIEGLGLDKRRVTFISAPSAIPASQRPIYVPGSKEVGAGINLARAHQETNLPALVRYIENMLESRHEKGLIHLTYSLAAMLKLTNLRNHPRLIWHTNQDKTAKYQEFLAAPEGKVLMASGLYEGIDLPGELGRWQILTKIPFPSLESPAIQFMAENDPSWYANEALKVVVQAVGRICRNPLDHGDSYVIDSNFTKLYNDYDDLVPNSFKEAVIDV